GLPLVRCTLMEFLGVEPSQLIGDRRVIRSYGHPDDQHLLDEQDRLLATVGHASLDLRMHRASGEQIWVRKEMRVVGTGSAREIIGYFTDITDRKIVEAETARQSVTDRVTGLPNRNRLDTYLAEVLAVHDRRVDLALV